LVPDRLADELIVVNFARYAGAKLAEKTAQSCNPTDVRHVYLRACHRLDTAMNRNDLRRVDMNLLVIFEALMFERT
jgi:hypothetical protein